MLQERRGSRVFQLRLWAWRLTPQPSKGPVELAEPYNCERDCQAANGWDPVLRSARGCKNLGLPPVKFAPSADALYQVRHGDSYMGRYPDKALHGARVLGIPQRHDRPFEDPEVGCPAAWYRTPWIDSLQKYMRRRTDTGSRVPNPRFDSADWQIQEAVTLYEQEQERAIAYLLRVNHDRAVARQEADAKQRANAPRFKGRR